MEEVIQQLKKELTSVDPPTHLITISKNELQEYVGIYKITNSNPFPVVKGFLKFP